MSACVKQCRTAASFVAPLRISPSALRYYTKHIEWYIKEANRCQDSQFEEIMRNSHLCRGIEPEELVDPAERQFDHTLFSAFENTRLRIQMILLAWSHNGLQTDSVCEALSIISPQHDDGGRENVSPQDMLPAIWEVDIHALQLARLVARRG